MRRLLLSVLLLAISCLTSGCETGAGVVVTDLLDLSEADLVAGDVGLDTAKMVDLAEELPGAESWELPPTDSSSDQLTQEEGAAGWPCVSDGDCLSSLCIPTPDGQQCTTTCIDECPFGWQCLLYGPSLPDELFVCVPTDVDLCRPCETNGDCFTDGTDGGQACVSYGPDGNFCGTACDLDDDCPQGYFCQIANDVAGSSVAQCVRSGGDCPCKQRFVDVGATTLCYHENVYGLCPGERACLGAGLTACDAPTPDAEACNGLDDNCDGSVDENVAAGGCEISNEFGDCPGIFECDDGELICIGAQAAPEICDGLDNNCDGATDEGFPDTNNDGIKDCLVSDKDGDDILDFEDNCPTIFNGDQADFDLDGKGDACDLDDDNDLSADVTDCKPLDPKVFPGNEELCNGIDDDCDLLVDEGFTDTDGDKLADCVDGDDDNDGAADEADCAPGDDDIFPGADESCNGVDDDCDVSVDEGFADTDEDGIADCVDSDADGDTIADESDNCPFVENLDQADLDGDGLGDLCDPDLDGDAIPNGTDNCPAVKNTGQADLDEDEIGDLCDDDPDGDDVIAGDNCPLVANPDQADSDEDGIGDACEEDLDGDGVANGLDCAPANPAIYPGAEEICDDIDNDCDILVDEGFGDSDNDGLKDCVDSDDDNDGDPDDADCAPNNPAISHNAVEACDNKDNDCDGKIDEELGSTTCGLGECAHKAANCANGVLQICNPFEGAAGEVCDGKDNDCDGLTDEDQGTTSCGLGQCSHSSPNCQGGEAQECDPLLGAGEELCDGLDNDCDGKTDEEQPALACGKGQCFHSMDSCQGGESQECNPFAGAGKEVCDGVDNDCDGETDEELGVSTCGLGSCLHTVDNCAAGVIQICNPFDGAVQEVCDGADNDCDGVVDDDLGYKSCGVGECEKTVSLCDNGQPDDCDPLAGATDEECDGLDNDCDGSYDEDFDDTDEDGEADCVDKDDDDDGIPDELDNCSLVQNLDQEDADDDDLGDLCDPDDDNDGDPDDTDCAPFDPTQASTFDEVCFNGIEDDCSDETPDECILASCKAYKAQKPGAVSGEFTIDPDGDGGVEPFAVACDMETGEGGWTRLQATNSQQVVVGSQDPTNPWNKCADDGAKYFDWLANENSVNADYAPVAEYTQDVPLSYANPISGQTLANEQVNALRAQVTELSDSTRMVAVTADDDSVDYHQTQSSGHEVYIQGTDNQWFLLTVGTNGECGGGAPSWPTGGSQSAFYLWSSSADTSIQSGTTGVSNGALGGLGVEQLIPRQVRLDVHTGGGVAFGWQKQDFLVR
jgi:hypothetical protein